MTVNDWYDQRRREEAMHGQSAPQKPSGKEGQGKNGNREFVNPLEENGEWGMCSGCKIPSGFLH